jgi:hypothetical protein
VRSSLVFSGNIRGALEEAIRVAREGQAKTIYLGRIGPYNKGGLYWRFYAAKQRATDMTAIDAGSFEPDAVLKLAPGSVVVTNAGEGQTEGTINALCRRGRIFENSGQGTGQHADVFRASPPARILTVARKPAK